MPTRFRPELPASLAGAAAGVFGTLSHLRGARIFHPAGASFRGIVRRHGTALHTGSPFLDGPGEHEALVRFSKAAGLPEPLPDVLGLAVRVIDADGPGRHRDLLFATSAAPPVLRHLLVPARGFGGRTFSAILPYRAQGRAWLLAATCPPGAPTFGALREGATPPIVTLLLASPTGPWTPFAEFVPRERLAQADSAALAFDPWNAGGDLLPSGLLNALRHPAYAASRRARPGRAGAGTGYGSAA